MRVIEQARLWFREGTSDKVYEVDLVEVAANQYVVNFRYGRRGTALKDGTKTATPLPQPKAKAVFDKLVAEKISGGYKYVAIGDAVAPPAKPAAGNGHAPTEGADQIVARLRLGHRGETPLRPAIWRAQDMDLHEAEPALIELFAAAPSGMQPSVWQHVLCSALVRCGTTAGLPKLTQVADDLRAEPYVRNIARLAIARIQPERARDLGRRFLTPALATALDTGDAGGLARAAEELLAQDPQKAQGAAAALYLIDEPLVRPAVLALARVARMSNAEAKVVRVLLRMSELRRDGELLALLGKRIDQYTGGAASYYTDKKLVPFAPPTRGYFKRRIARVLRRLARAGSPDYVTMAAALLRSFTDEDAEAPREGSSGYGSPVYFDAFAKYHALNDIIYGQSPRYERAHHIRATWKCKGRYRPGQPAPVTREERFPLRWDAAPDTLWALIGAARATIVVEFAVKALRDNRAYAAALPDRAVADVLATGLRPAQLFAFELARPRPMSTELARGGLGSDLGEAHAWVLAWINANVATAIADAEMVSLLVTGKTSVIRDAALALLTKHEPTDEVRRSAAARALAILLALRDGSNERASAAASIMLLVFAQELLGVSPAVLRDMIAHPLPALGELAGEIMLRHPQRDSLPADLIEALLASPHAALRLLGGRLLAQMPPEIAAEDPGALVLFATSPNAELREGTRTLLGEVAKRFPDAGRAVAAQLVHLLLTPLPEGAPAHIVTLMRAELARCLPRVPTATILKLIGALSPHAREAGGLLLPQLLPDDIGLDDIARLAHHEILAVRHGAWTLATASVDRYRLAPVALSRLVDSQWPDTRAFAIAFIRDQVKTLSADAIVAICDSIRPEVQELGKQLLHEQFQTAQAGTYVVKLAEHPSTNIQLLVSTMLEQHVAGDLARLSLLAPYLVTVLSQVNRGRVAKERVINLLRSEAAKSREAAEVIAPILDRQSATIAVTQKHPLIATMVEVKETFPDVSLPIEIRRPGAA